MTNPFHSQDERPSICGKCPHERSIGAFPKTVYINEMMRERGIKAYSNMANYPCKHTVTKNLICTIPCNGVYDLCEDNLDEQCQGPGLAMTLISIFLLSMTFILSSSGLSYHRLKKNQVINIAEMELKHVKSKEGIRKCCEHTRSDGTNIYLRLSVCKKNMEVANAIEIAAIYYSQVSGGTCYEKDYNILLSMGTNVISAYFYDCMEISLAIRVHLWFHSKVSILFTIPRKIYFGAIMILMKGTVSLCIRYSDFAKDLLFLYMIWLQLGQYEDGSFPKAVFYILALSLLLTEFGNICVILMADFKGLWWRKMFVIILAPLMPAYYLYEIIHCEFYKFIILNSCCGTNEKSQDMEICSRQFYELDQQIWSLQLKLAKLQYVENVFENIPQLTILLLISLLNLTSSRNVVNLQNIFMGDRIYIGWGLAAISVVSLIRGQVNFLATTKNGCQTGIVLLIVYFFLGLSSMYLI